MRTRTPVLLLLVTLLPGVVTDVRAQDVPAGSLTEARALYSSAEYHRALSLLDQLVADTTQEGTHAAAGFYRALCLLALGREDEATTAVEILVAEHPSYRPEQELPPRVQVLFDETRARLLPTAIQSKYLSARAAYDQRDYRSALQGFTETLELFTQPEVARMAGGPPLADLLILADGFLELSAEALSVSRHEAPIGPAEPVAPPPPPRLYSVADRDVVPPMVVEQTIPNFPGPVRSSRAGVIEVVIDEKGGVVSARMLESIGDRYDALALAAAGGWRYEPATLSGTPVPFVKRIRVSLIPSP